MNMEDAGKDRKKWVGRDGCENKKNSQAENFAGRERIRFDSNRIDGGKMSVGT